MTTALNGNGELMLMTQCVSANMCMRNTMTAVGEKAET
jgi:hypothetical protein